MHQLRISTALIIFTCTGLTCTCTFIGIYCHLFVLCLTCTNSSIWRHLLIKWVLCRVLCKDTCKLSWHMYNASMCLGVWVSFHNHDSAHATWYIPWLQHTDSSMCQACADFNGKLIYYYTSYNLSGMHVLCLSLVCTLKEKVCMFIFSSGKTACLFIP